MDITVTIMKTVGKITDFLDPSLLVYELVCEDFFIGDIMMRRIVGS